MTIQEAIKKAMNGGWQSNYVIDDSEKSVFGYITLDCKITSATIDEFHSREWAYEKIVMDPEFWKSLGRTLGWVDSLEEKGHNCKDRLRGFCLTHKREWKTYWHRLIDHIAEGGTIESYFENL